MEGIVVNTQRYLLIGGNIEGSLRIRGNWREYVGNMPETTYK